MFITKLLFILSDQLVVLDMIYLQRVGIARIPFIEDEIVRVAQTYVVEFTKSYRKVTNATRM